MKPFNHNFETAFGVLDYNGIAGYTNCLSELHKYIERTTQFNPAKRMIDAVPLLDKIAATNDELAKLLKKEREKLEEVGLGFLLSDGEQNE